MTDFLTGLFGAENAQTAMYVLFAIAILIGLFVLWMIVRAIRRPRAADGRRSKQARLAVTDAAAIDPRRRLVLVRRDDVEHLIMIGGPTDIVIEQDIRRHSSVRQTQATPAPAPQQATVAKQPAPQSPTPPSAPAQAAPAKPAPAQPAPTKPAPVKAPEPTSAAAPVLAAAGTVAATGASALAATSELAKTTASTVSDTATAATETVKEVAAQATAPEKPPVPEPAVSKQVETPASEGIDALLEEISAPKR